MVAENLGTSGGLRGPETCSPAPLGRHEILPGSTRNTVLSAAPLGNSQHGLGRSALRPDRRARDKVMLHFTERLNEFPTDGSARSAHSGPWYTLAAGPGDVRQTCIHALAERVRDGTVLKTHRKMPQRRQSEACSLKRRPKDSIIFIALSIQQQLRTRQERTRTACSFPVGNSNSRWN